MAEAIMALDLWHRMGQGVNALEKLGKLIILLTKSWSTLKKRLNQNQRRSLKARRLREDLLLIAHDLREVHFAMGEQKVMNSNEFLFEEVKTVLAIVEKACGSKPNLYELEVAMNKAEFIQARVTERVGRATEPVRIEWQPRFPELLAKSIVVTQALETADPNWKIEDMDQYDSAAESDSDFFHDASETDGYVSCDEDELWMEVKQKVRDDMHSVVFAEGANGMVCMNG